MNTLFDKIWDSHVVQIVKDGPTQLYIDRLYGHEVTTPQAFDGLRQRGLKVFRPKQNFARSRTSSCPTIIFRPTIKTSPLRIR